MTVLFAIGMTVFMLCFASAEYRLKKTQRLLNEAQKNTYSTPIKELTANFRDFVQSIDGHVSPEVDAAIKKLETQETKLLPAASSGHQVMDKENWKLFWAEFDDEQYTTEALNVLKYWGEKFTFSLEQQSKIVRQFNYSSDREKVRKYFKANP